MHTTQQYVKQGVTIYAHGDCGEDWSVFCGCVFCGGRGGGQGGGEREHLLADALEQLVAVDEQWTLPKVSDELAEALLGAVQRNVAGRVLRIVA
jgi:hypothetical protein